MTTSSNSTSADSPGVAMLSAITTPCFWVNRSGNIETWNQAMTDLTGRTPEDVIGKKTWRGFFSRRHHTPVADALVDLESIEEEFQFRPKGAKRPIEYLFRASPVLASEGEIQGVLCELHPLPTEEAEEANPHRLMFERTSTPLMVVDQAGTIQDVNAPLVDLLRTHLPTLQRHFPAFQADSLQGVAVRQLPGPLGRLESLLSGTSDGRESVHFDFDHVHLKLTVLPLHAEDTHLGTLVEWYDLSDRYEREKERVRLVAQIENSALGIMFCDLDHTITYINPTLRHFFEVHLEEFRDELPNFDPKSLLGRKLELFDAQSEALPISAQIENAPCVMDWHVNSLEFRLHLVPLRTDSGEKLGYTLEWTDLRELTAYRQELDRVVQAAKAGNLSVRGHLDQLSGDYATGMRGINHLLSSLVAPFREAATGLEQLAHRDLTARIAGEYSGEHASIKDNFNIAVESLGQAVAQVAQTVEQLQGTSLQVGTVSQALAESTNAQASNVEEISATLEELTAMTEQNAKNALQSRTIAKSARTSAERGFEAMNRLADAIQRIKRSSDDTTDIIKTIEEIAFQTNLLALNATVEAARAGDAGKGFAVVADEVRNLAQRSSEAAKLTTQLMKSAVSNAADCVTVGAEVGQRLEDIVEGAVRVDNVVAEITTASGEQAKGIRQINKAVIEVNTATQQNAANSEQCANAAEELADQANDLSSMVQSFQLPQVLQHGGYGQAAAPMQWPLAHMQTPSPAPYWSPYPTPAGGYPAPYAHAPHYPNGMPVPSPYPVNPSPYYLGHAQVPGYGGPPPGPPFDPRAAVPSQPPSSDDKHETRITDIPPSNLDVPPIIEDDLDDF